MCCKYVSTLVSVAFVLLVLASLACSVGFVAPFWLNFPEVPNTLPPAGLLGRRSNPDRWIEGLWATCIRTGSKCSWFWEDDFRIQNSFPAYHKVAQGLYLGGLTILLAVLLAASPYVCCNQCLRSITITPILGTLTLASIVCMTASLAVYGAFSARDRDARVTPVEGSESPTFYWAYFAGVGGLAAALLAALLLLADSCTNRDRYSYQRASTSSSYR